MLGDVIARLSVSLGLETAAFEKGSRKASQEVQSLSGQMTKAAKAIGAALTGMVAWEAVQTLRDWTRAAIDSAGAMGEQAAALGVSTDALQEYRYAATQVGLEASEMDLALAQLTRRLGDATLAGKGPVVEALEKLGITLADIKGKSAGDVIPLIADGMKALSTDTERAAVAVDLFGKSGQKLATLLAGGAAEVDKLRAAAHELGIVLSEDDIQQADEVADKLSALNFVIEAQKNKKLLENAESLLKFEESLGKLKLELIDTINWLDDHPPEMVQSWFNQAFGIENGPVFDAMHLSLDEIGQAFAGAWKWIEESASGIYHGLRNWLGARLDKLWDGAMARIDAVAAKFNWLYDVVIGHSYVPDMVDGIAAEMARLDAVMVTPAGKATSATAKKFQDLRDLMDRLFPEVGKANQFNADTAAIEASGLNAAAKEQASARLWREFASGSPFGGGGMGGPDFGGDGGPLVEGMGATEDAIQRLTDRAKIGTVKIAESFKDMADKTLASLSRLTSAIKGGDFLGILEGVIGLGLQLGSMGAFGSGIAGKLNSVSKIPKWANGTNFHPGGLALVGESGPELVSMPRGSRVTPNHAMGGVTNNYFSGNLLTPEFWAQIQQGDIQAAQGGAMLAGARKARSDKWSLAA